jgi:hypothetical protein
MLSVIVLLAVVAISGVSSTCSYHYAAGYAYAINHCYSVLYVSSSDTYTSAGYSCVSNSSVENGYQLRTGCDDAMCNSGSTCSSDGPVLECGDSASCMVECADDSEDNEDTDCDLYEQKISYIDDETNCNAYTPGSFMTSYVYKECVKTGSSTSEKKACGGWEGIFYDYTYLATTSYSDDDCSTAITPAPSTPYPTAPYTPYPTSPTTPSPVTPTYDCADFTHSCSDSAAYNNLQISFIGSMAVILSAFYYIL